MSRFFPALAATIESLLAESAAAPPARIASLEALAGYVRDRGRAGETARLVFICTHNSRRSHLAAIWARAAAAWFGVAGVETFSGGTEATAFHPDAVDALRRAGFRIEREDGGANPAYAVRFADDGPPVRATSKRFDDPANPRTGFAAVMTCTDADAACPVVPGADARIRLPYEDPKRADGTVRADAVYDACCREIGREMLVALGRVVG